MTAQNYLKKRIAQGEGLHLDFKFEVSDSRKIARSLVAFANTEGGSLLLGVKDNGAIAGVRSEEEVYMIETAARIYSRPEIPFSTQILPWEGKTVVEVRVGPARHKPHFAKDESGEWRPWLRVADENILASPVVLRIWELENRREGILFAYDAPFRFLVRFLGKYGRISLRIFSEKTRVPLPAAIDLFAGLCVLDILKIQPASLEDQFVPGEAFETGAIEKIEY